MSREIAGRLPGTHRGDVSGRDVTRNEAAARRDGCLGFGAPAQRAMQPLN